MAEALRGLDVEEGDSKEAIQAKLRLAMERLEMFSGGSKPITIAPKDKKLSKYSGKGDIDQWLEDCDIGLARITQEKDKVNYILDHLEGAAKTEVKFQVNIKDTTAKQILDALRNVYGSHDTWMQLQHQFHSRDQKSSEDLMEYTHVLMELLLELRDKIPGGIGNMDEWLKLRVAEGVTDVALKRELKRLNEERPTLKFHQFREHAVDWLESGKKSKRTATQEEHTVSSEIAELKQLIQQQQQQIQ